MEKQTFRKRFVSPVLVVFSIMAVSWCIYNLSWQLESNTMHQRLALIFGTLYFISVLFGPIVVYIWAYSRGATLGERILASAINPFLWATKECLRLLTSFTIFESLYYYFNPLSIWFACFLMTEMGLAEIIYRANRSARGDKLRIIHPAAICAVFIGLALVIAAYSWGRGENIYVLFLDGYRTFFGSGV
jgi:hypothetical protein